MAGQMVEAVVPMVRLMVGVMAEMVKQKVEVVVVAL